MRQIIFHGYRTEFTGPHTEHAADTACIARFFDLLALIVRTTCHTLHRRRRNQFNQPVRAFLHTCAARHTFFLIHNRDAIYHMDRIKFTCRHAGAITHTAVTAKLLPAPWQKCCFLTVCNTVVAVFHYRFVTGSVAFHKRYFLFRGSCALPHNLADLRMNRSTCYRTGIYCGFPCRDRLC